MNGVNDLNDVMIVGGTKVVHFTSDFEICSGGSSCPASCSSMYQTPLTGSSSFPASYSSMSQTPLMCMAYPDCGFRQPESGVVLSCLDCFLQNGSLYRFTYGVRGIVFCAKVGGGSCTTAMSDESEIVIHRAMHLLHNGFGKYDVFTNHCEDFALYCKTGLLIVKNIGFGTSGQIESAFGAAPFAALVSYPLKWLLPAPVAATLTIGTYSFSGYASDIGQRSDVVKLNVEDLVVIWRIMNDKKQESQDN